MIEIIPPSALALNKKPKGLPLNGTSTQFYP